MRAERDEIVEPCNSSTQNLVQKPEHERDWSAPRQVRDEDEQAFTVYGGVRERRHKQRPYPALRQRFGLTPLANNGHLNATVGRKAAVYGDDDTGHEARGARRQPNSRPNELFGFAKPSYWRVRDNLLPPLGQ